MHSIHVLSLMCDRVKRIDSTSITGNGGSNCQALYFVDQSVEVREDLNRRSVQNHLAR